MVCGEKTARLYKNIQISLYSSFTSLPLFSGCIVISLKGRVLLKHSEEMLEASGVLLSWYIWVESQGHLGQFIPTEESGLGCL